MIATCSVTRKWHQTPDLRHARVCVCPPPPPHRSCTVETWHKNVRQSGPAVAAEDTGSAPTGRWGMVTQHWAHCGDGGGGFLSVPGTDDWGLGTGY